MNEQPDLTQVAIKEFLNSSDGSKRTTVTLNDKKSVKGVLIKSSRIINKNFSRQTRSEVIIDLKNSGELRELTIVSDTAMNFVSKVDNESILDGISQWSELNAITLYTDIISARTNGSNYIFVIKNIRYTKSLFLQVYFDSNATISSVFGVYDIFEVL